MHKNNFDFLRLLFSCMVIVSHCYALTSLEQRDILFSATKGQTDFALIALKGFFILSGYLISQSVFTSISWRSYFLKRVLRIFPGLFFALLTGLLVGYIVSGKTVVHYFSNHTAITYVPKNFTLVTGIQQYIDGVFENNINHCVNGTIWTIPHEVFYYLVISVLFLFKRTFEKFLFLFPLIIFISVWTYLRISSPDQHFLKGFPLELHNVARFGLCFMAGSLLYFVNIESYKYKWIIAFVCLIMLIISISISQYDNLNYFFLPPVIIILGSSSFRLTSGLSKKIGDFSYGAYLYGFLLQQTLVHYFKLDHTTLLWISLPGSIIIGEISWHFIEKRFLKLKPKQVLVK